jgi:hypothetical protein
VSFDETLEDLLAVTRQLHDLGEDDPGRHDLVVRRAALREQMEQYRGLEESGRSVADLRRELAAVNAAIEGIKDERIDLVKQAGGGGAGEFGNWGAFTLNQSIEAARGIDGLRVRRRQLEHELRRRGAALEDPTPDERP